MKFSDYDEKKHSAKKGKTGGAEKTGTTTLDPKTERMIKTLLGRYEGKSKDEIMTSILSMAQKSRSEGKLSDAEIDYFYSLLAPMLDEEKLKMLDEVVDKIKKQ